MEAISTCPLSYKRWKEPNRPDWDLLVQNIVRMAAAMFESKRQDGQDIHLDIEPEPDGLVETTDEFIQFFERLLHTGAPLLAKSAQLSVAQAEDALRRHIAFCYDLCHSTVEYEESRAVIDTLRNAGVRIGRVQVSSAVKIALPPQSGAREHLRHSSIPYIFTRRSAIANGTPICRTRWIGLTAPKLRVAHPLPCPAVYGELWNPRLDADRSS